MPRDPIRIAVGRDRSGWCDKFSHALERKIQEGHRLSYEVIDIWSPDWLDLLDGIQVVIWNPVLMGPRAAQHLKEKVYFLERHLNRLVIPNYETVWHFESKVAQSYVFNKHGIPTPRTVISSDYHKMSDALRDMQPPFVFKSSHGAGGKYVIMVRSHSRAMRELTRICSRQLWREARRRAGSRFKAILSNLHRAWLWHAIASRLRSEEQYTVPYVQEFVAGNDKDLRITAIGDRYAFGFWRRNRRNDFRASGSGLVDYELPIPEELVRYCLELNKSLSLDTMAYDIIFRNGLAVMLEMSYTYSDDAIHDCRGHFVLQPDGALTFREGRTWPQELWVDWAVHRAETEL